MRKIKILTSLLCLLVSFPSAFAENLWGVDGTWGVSLIEAKGEGILGYVSDTLLKSWEINRSWVLDISGDLSHRICAFRKVKTDTLQLSIGQFTQCKCTADGYSDSCRVYLGMDAPISMDLLGATTEVALEIGKENHLFINADGLAKKILDADKKRHPKKGFPAVSWSRGECSRHLYQKDYNFCVIDLGYDEEFTIPVLVNELLKARR